MLGDGHIHQASIHLHFIFRCIDNGDIHRTNLLSHINGIGLITTMFIYLSADIDFQRGACLLLFTIVGHFDTLYLLVKSGEGVLVCKM